MSEPHEEYNPYEHEPLPEGVEAPPPYVHTMAIVRWIILGAISIFALFMVLSYFGATPWSSTQASAVMYHCPMHPTYVSNQPGECPICGMTLVPINDNGKSATVTDSTKTMAGQGARSDTTVKAKPGQYTCPMDPEVVSDEPSKCPKCGMNLELVSKPETNAGDGATSGAKAGQYSCPMDPQVVAEKPGACPICGMTLLLVSEPVSSSGQAIDMSGMSMPETQATHDSTTTGTVPGLVTVTIEPERQQLINIRIGEVEQRIIANKLRLAGYVTADETHTANVHIRASGWVRDLFVDQTGQYVKAGQPLLSLYSPELAQAQQDLMVARKATQKTIADSELTLHETTDASSGASKAALARAEPTGYRQHRKL